MKNQKKERVIRSLAKLSVYLMVCCLPLGIIVNWIYTPIGLPIFYLGLLGVVGNTLLAMKYGKVLNPEYYSEK